jgi:hypothetical protein
MKQRKTRRLRRKRGSKECTPKTHNGKVKVKLISSQRLVKQDIFARCHSLPTEGLDILRVVYTDFTAIIGESKDQGHFVGRSSVK